MKEVTMTGVLAVLGGVDHLHVTNHRQKRDTTNPYIYGILRGII